MELPAHRDASPRQDDVFSRRSARSVKSIRLGWWRGICYLPRERGVDSRVQGRASRREGVHRLSRSCPKLPPSPVGGVTAPQQRRP